MKAKSQSNFTSNSEDDGDDNNNSQSRLPPLQTCVDSRRQRQEPDPEPGPGPELKEQQYRSQPPLKHRNYSQRHRQRPRGIVYLLFLSIIFLLSFYCGTHHFVESSKSKSKSQCDGSGRWFLGKIARSKIQSRHQQQHQQQHQQEQDQQSGPSKRVRSELEIHSEAEAPLVLVEAASSNYHDHQDQEEGYYYSPETTHQPEPTTGWKSNTKSKSKHHHHHQHRSPPKGKETSLFADLKSGIIDFLGPWPLLITVLGLPLILIPLLAICWLTLLKDASYSPFQQYQQPYHHHHHNHHGHEHKPQYDYTQYDRQLT